MKKKKKPVFNVPNAGSHKRGKLRVKDRWRKPRGDDNKKRIRKKEHGALPRVGYKQAAKIRNMHPCGKREVMISNLKEIENVSNEFAIRIKHGVGMLKRIAIEKIADSKKIKVLNRLKTDKIKKHTKNIKNTTPTKKTTSKKETIKTKKEENKSSGKTKVIPKKE